MPPVDQHLRAVARSRPQTPFWILEKDYALGYLLAGMARVPELHDVLVLKGGTALRKFYFRDYRFSEDLDFSALARPTNPYDAMQEAVAAAEAELQERGPFAVTLERLQLREPPRWTGRLQRAGALPRPSRAPLPPQGRDHLR
ncbi:MAG: nucleotidyl transferase AbiEii/AbiGii toxin family protein [Chloroflexota bacterium]|nr:nucleotidyl transferase AbiEii/AbiGii toxin family protein [Chloroflexota bacterium]